MADTPHTIYAISWSGLRDSSGRKISNYWLDLREGGLVEWMPKLMAVFATLVWQLFMIVSTVAATLLGIMSNPSWLNGLSNAYKKLTESLFGLVHPLVLATLGFVLMVGWMFLDKARTNSSRLDQHDYNRLAAGFFMMVAIAALTANPFTILKSILGFVHSMTAYVVGKDAADYAVFSVDAMIRQPTLIITYNGAVPAECADLWSQRGTLDRTTCVEAGVNTPDVGTVLLALLALLMGVSALVFAALAFWKYAKHLTVAVLGFVSLPWVAALSMFRRRQFDQLGAVAAVAFGHLAMVLVVQVIAVGGPALVSEVVGGWTTGHGVLQMLVLMLSYWVLAAAIHTITGKSSAVVRALKADTSTALRTYMGTPGAGWSISDSSSLLNDIRRTNVYRTLQGRAAEVMGFDKKGRKGDDLAPAQKTVNLEGQPARFAPLDANGSDGVADHIPQWDDRKPEFVSAVKAGHGLGAVSSLAKVLSDDINDIEAARRRKGLRPMRSPNLRLDGDAEEFTDADRAHLIRLLAQSEGGGKDAEDRAAAMLSSASNAHMAALYKNLAVHVMLTDPNAPFGGKTPPGQIKATLAEMLAELMRQAARDTGQPTIAEVSTEAGEVNRVQAYKDYLTARSSRDSEQLRALVGGDVSHDANDEVQRTLSGPRRNDIRHEAVEQDFGGRNMVDGSPAVQSPTSPRFSGSYISQSMNRYQEEILVEATNILAAVLGLDKRNSLSDSKFNDLLLTGDPDRPVRGRYGEGFGDDIGL